MRIIKIIFYYIVLIIALILLLPVALVFGPVYFYETVFNKAKEIHENQQ